MPDGLSSKPAVTDGQAVYPLSSSLCTKEEANVVRGPGSTWENYCVTVQCLPCSADRAGSASTPGLPSQSTWGAAGSLRAPCRDQYLVYTAHYTTMYCAHFTAHSIQHTSYSTRYTASFTTTYCTHLNVNSLNAHCRLSQSLNHLGYPCLGTHRSPA